MANAIEQWNDSFAQCPLIAILRGLSPRDALGVCESLYKAGIRIVEVPLNSPKPLESIDIIAKSFGNKMLIGAGTVLDAESAQASIDAGGRLIVAPNVNSKVAEVAAQTGSIYCPGVATPTEAFKALNLGATALKLFPGELITPTVVKAIRAVLPIDTNVLPVGGIGLENMQQYWQAGANGFGIGSGIYKVDQSAELVAEAAKQYVEKVSAISSSSA